MYNLSLEGTGRQGYFRWKEDICAFIGRHWTFLLGSRWGRAERRLPVNAPFTPDGERGF